MSFGFSKPRQSERPISICVSDRMLQENKNLSNSKIKRSAAAETITCEMRLHQLQTNVRQLTITDFDSYYDPETVADDFKYAAANMK